MTDRSKAGDSDAQRPLIASDSTTDDSNTSLDLPLMEDPSSNSSSSEINGSEQDHEPNLSNEDNASKLTEANNEEETSLLSDSRPPRVRRKEKTKTNDSSSQISLNGSDTLENGEQDDIEANKSRRRRKKAETEATTENEIEMSSISASQRKSVRWTDDMDGGALHQEHVALSYNRKELSYAPRSSRIRVGIFSPLQKKLMIGVGSGCAILLIILFVVLFVVIKPGSDAPSAPPPTGLFPIVRQPPPPPDAISAPDNLTPQQISDPAIGDPAIAPL